jgi:hypothetical protein
MCWLVSVAMIATLSMLLGPALAADAAPLSVSKPLNSLAPTLTGTPTVGSTLSCSQGTWTNSPTSFSYTWLRSGTAIAGQTGSSYVVQSADKGTSLSCQVTAANSDGQYTISGLPSGSYRVAFYPEEGGNYLVQYFNGKSAEGEANPVSVTAGSETSGINAAVAPGGEITGRVTGAGGTPLMNVEASAHSTTGGYGGEAYTNANGEYTIAGLPSGSYTVVFSPANESGYITQYYNGKSSEGEAEAIGVSAGSQTAGINAALQPASSGGQITGRVTSAAHGTPLQGVEVSAEKSDGYGSALTNANGEYTISGLTNGSYIVTFSPASGTNYLTQYYENKSTSGAANPVVVSAGSPATADAALVAGGEITGRVTSAAGGAPLSGAEVSAYDAAAEAYGSASTNANGEYTIPGLPTGSYTVRFFPASESNYLVQYYAGTSIEADATPVSVTAGAAPKTGIDAALATGGQITGRVTSAASGIPLAGVSVSTEGGYVSTNANGEYTVSGLPSGSYKVAFYPEEGANYLLQYFNGKSTEGEANAVEVTVGSATTGINSALLAAGQITGTVTNAVGGAPLPDIGVDAVNTSGYLSGFGYAVTDTGGGSASATSNALAVPAPNSSFAIARSPVFDAKTGDLEFFFKVVEPGAFRWSLTFKNADVGFADAVDLAFAEAAKKAKHCKAGLIKHKGKCVHVTVPFASGSKSVAAGTVELKIHADPQALKALKQGRTLHVSGPFSFQSALGGAPVTHTESLVVKVPKPKKKKKK